MKLRLGPSVAAALLVAASAARASGAVEVVAASVHLLMSPSGEFSEDVAAREGFSSWNFKPSVPIGQPDQEFHSYLVKVRLKASSEAVLKGKIATISVLRRDDHRVLYESKIGNLYFPAGGEAVVARMVDGLVCEPVTVVVTAGRSRVSKDLDFRCGE
jgi:hypothetical protein